MDVCVGICNSRTRAWVVGEAARGQYESIAVACVATVFVAVFCCYSMSRKKHRPQALAREHDIRSIQPAAASTRFHENASTIDPTSLIHTLREAGLQQTTAFGKTSGSWVTDDTIIELLDFLTQAACPTFQMEQYDVRVCYIDSHTKKVDVPDPDSKDLPDKILVMLVIHTVSETAGMHFSSMVINPRFKLIHAFDTVTHWPKHLIKNTITAQFPNMELLKHGYEVRNHTGKARQSGATCGPCSLWILFAYACNYNKFRDKNDKVDCSRIKQSDALAFWRAFTV